MPYRKASTMVSVFPFGIGQQLAGFFAIQCLYAHLVRFQILCISFVVMDVNVRTIAACP